MRTAGESVPADLPQQISEDERRSNVKISSRTRKALREAEESLAVKLPLHFQEADPYSNDHNYALPACPTALKARLSEALARVESLERERRNSRIRERRARKNVDALLDAMYSLHAML
ncbi:unnamed protein product [Tetraodon nigroviridis]|uniref:(spotted green pufferfish) hypothetical protein n=1 Tax=Tetraodon nigroviridis TaxID=99883 RepID=Q4RYV7_TETNG|nr:unnamed protein product [Tetraodon nigroviridis]